MELVYGVETGLAGGVRNCQRNNEDTPKSLPSKSEISPTSLRASEINSCDAQRQYPKQPIEA